MKKLTKKERNTAYRKVYETNFNDKNPFNAGLCYDLLEIGINKYGISSHNAIKVFDEFKLFVPVDRHDITGTWFDNHDERWLCLAFLITLSE